MGVQFTNPWLYLADFLAIVCNSKIVCTFALVEQVNVCQREGFPTRRVYLLYFSFMQKLTNSSYIVCLITEIEGMAALGDLFGRETHELKNL